GDVDEIHGALGKLEPREARHDGQPPRLLLGQPVGVDAGERPHEARLAVVDVTDDADRALLHRNAASSDATSAATSLAATVRISSRNASRWTRPTTAGRWARHARASSRAERPSTLTRRATLGNVDIGSAPPPGSDACSTRSQRIRFLPARAAATRAARRRTCAGVAASMRNAGTARRARPSS